MHAQLHSASVQPPFARDAHRVGPGVAQRLRLISSVADLVCERGVAAATVGEIVSRAGVSRRTFYELFEDRGDCMLAAIDYTLGLAAERARAAQAPAGSWVERTRLGLAALLRVFDEEPRLARLCVLESAAAGPAGMARRCEVLDELARLVDQGRDRAPAEPPPLTAEWVVGGAVAAVGNRLLRPGSGSLIELLNPLMCMVVLPYRGQAAAHGQLHLPTPAEVDDAGAGPRAPSSVLEAVRGLPIRATYRTLAVLAALAAEPDLSNVQVSARAGIRDKGQVSRLMSRLAQLGLVENTGGGQAMGAANAWHLTTEGTFVRDAMEHALAASHSRGAARRRLGLPVSG